MEKLHGKQMSSLIQIIQSETWKQVLVSEQFQIMIDKILSINKEPNKNLKIDNNSSISTSYGIAKTIKVNSLSFNMLNCSLELIQMLSNYLQCLEYFSVISFEILHRIMDILAVYIIIIIILIII